MNATSASYPEQTDSRWHPRLVDLESALCTLPPPPRDAGSLAAIMRRPAPQHRESLESAHLTVEEGLPGDAWFLRPARSPDSQLAVINLSVARLIANGQPLGLFGDNLFVNLDLSTQNLPAGTRVQVGAATVEVTPLPHNGCRKFLGRFGPEALQLVQSPGTRPLNYRGIYWKVLRPGRIQVGDPLTVIHRP